MAFNLLREPWIPVLRQSGSFDSITPHQIAARDDPPVDIAAPRPDFRAGLLEFLVGLLQTFHPPADRKEWRRLLAEPPDPLELRDVLKPHARYFQMFGDGPRFLQDLALDPEEQDGRFPVRSLLIDVPGDADQLNPASHFQQREGGDQFCPACAAMALFTMQAFAPSGGRGNRTSLRGGGPLTTLVKGRDLWSTVWRNVIPLDQSHAKAPTADELPGAVLPWAAPTPTSENGETFLPESAHPFHAYWGMPRRFALVPEPLDNPEPCGLCGQASDLMVREFRQRPYGINYGPTWRHPLTPYRQDIKDRSLLSVKGRALISGYTQWLAVVWGEPLPEDGARLKYQAQPAMCTMHCLHASYGHRGLPDDSGPPRLYAAGYDMDNMKPLQFCEGEYPVYNLDPERLEAFRALVQSLTHAASEARGALLQALKSALAHEKAKVKIDASRLEAVGLQFWADTEAAFYATVEACLPAPGDEATTEKRREWLHTLFRAAENLFHTEVENEAFHPDHARRVSTALVAMRKRLHKRLREMLGLPKTDKKRGDAT